MPDEDISDAQETNYIPGLNYSSGRQSKLPPQQPLSTPRQQTAAPVKAPAPVKALAPVRSVPREEPPAPVIKKPAPVTQKSTPHQSPLHTSKQPARPSQQPQQRVINPSQVDMSRPPPSLHYSAGVPPPSMPGVRTASKFAAPNSILGNPRPPPPVQAQQYHNSNMGGGYPGPPAGRPNGPPPRMAGNRLPPPGNLVFYIDSMLIELNSMCIRFDPYEKNYPFKKNSDLVQTTSLKVLDRFQPYLVATVVVRINYLPAQIIDTKLNLEILYGM
jgi:hypothetical protein